MNFFLRHNCCYHVIIIIITIKIRVIKSINQHIFFEHKRIHLEKFCISLSKMKYCDVIKHDFIYRRMLKHLIYLKSGTFP